MPLEFTDHLEICNLLYGYCFHFDRNEPDQIALLFSEDVSIDYGPEYPSIHGREAAEASIASGLRERFLATSHHVSNIVIQKKSSNTATGNAYVYAWHRYRDGSPDGELWGQYQLSFSKISGHWLITDLKLAGVGTREFHRSRMHSIGRRES